MIDLQQLHQHNWSQILLQPILLAQLAQSFMATLMYTVSTLLFKVRSNNCKALQFNKNYSLSIFDLIFFIILFKRLRTVGFNKIVRSRDNRNKLEISILH